MVVLARPDAWQIGYVVAKGGFLRLRAQGLEALRRSIAARAPWLGDRVGELRDWRQTSLLVVEAGRVRRWYRPGLLLIGDAAHVMSPVGGVGINYAVQDAIAAANRLGPPLRQGRLRTADLAAVQRRRELPTRLMQFFQRQLAPRFDPSGRPLARAPWRARMLGALPVSHLRNRLVAYGGFRPERVRQAPCMAHSGPGPARAAPLQVPPARVPTYLSVENQG